MSKRVEIAEEVEIFERLIFRIVEARLSFERYDGTMSREVVRLSVERGDSVAAVLHDTSRDAIVLTEQFRYPTHHKGPGWLLELPAGVLGADEQPIEAIQREVAEEVGYAVSTLEPIGMFYVSPGGTSERIQLFYAQVTPAEHESPGGGVASEGEDIRTVRMPVSEALERLRDGTIVDAKTIIGLQWLALARDRTR